MVLRQDPDLEREPGGKRHDRDKTVDFNDHAILHLDLLTDEIAENAALMSIVILARSDQFFFHALGIHRRCDQLRSAVFDPAAACGPSRNS